MSVAVIRKFPGGVHPKETGNGKSATQYQPIRDAKPPVRVVIALQQHMGAPCESVVKAGERVDLGQVIGRSEARISAAVHASVSGRVVKLDHCMLASGISVPAVVIDNDFEDRWHPTCVPHPGIEQMDAQQMLQIVREAGIVGLGGATFPTAVKLAPPPEKPVDTILLNGAECEPYLTCDHRLMLENAAEIVDGLLLAQRMLGAKNAIVGIEDNKPDAIEAMRKALEGKAEVVALPTHYPQGGEKQLIYALTGRTVPIGALPADVGTVVINVGTAGAISAALRQGRPLIDRVITLAGHIASPANLRARIGTTIADLIDECGGLSDGVEKVLHGGPMMGMALPRLDLPVTKMLNGLLAFGADSESRRELPCMHCGRCVSHCPMRLMPFQLDAAARHSRWDVAESFQAMACIECGVCTFVCPSKRLITQGCRTCKAALQAKRAQQADQMKA